MCSKHVPAPAALCLSWACSFRRPQSPEDEARDILCGVILSHVPVVRKRERLTRPARPLFTAAACFCANFFFLFRLFCCSLVSLRLLQWFVRADWPVRRKNNNKATYGGSSCRFCQKNTQCLLSCPCSCNRSVAHPLAAKGYTQSPHGNEKRSSGAVDTVQSQKRHDISCFYCCVTCGRWAMTSVRRSSTRRTS